MADREKVIKGLKQCATGCSTINCPYWMGAVGICRLDCMNHLLTDTLELLKEQEAEIERQKQPDCEHANHDGKGCLGYCGCEQDDEPIDACKQCEKYTGNICAEY